MAANKTQPTKQSPTNFIRRITDPRKRKDCQAIATMMRKIVGKNGKMWGSSIVGYGDYHYVYESGREGDLFLAGFSPRAQNLTIYVMPGFERYKSIMKKLGKHSTGKACLYIKRLEDVDQAVLEQLIEKSVAYMKEKYDIP